MSQFTIYRSTDNGAPALTGRTGSLITVLNSILVDGYGGTGSLGWTRVDSASFDSASINPASVINQAVYLMPSKSIYMRVKDNAISTSAEATIHMDEVGNYPGINSDKSLLGFVRKSTQNSDISRSWTLFGDQKTFYMYILPGDFTDSHMAWMFGEFDSYIPNDPWNAMFIGKSEASSSNYGLMDTIASSLAATLGGHYMCRTYGRTYMTSSITVPASIGKHGDYNKSISNRFVGMLSFPNPSDGGLYLSPLWIHETGTSTIRGKMRGFWQFLHRGGEVLNGDIFSGTGSLNGKTFTVVSQSYNNAVFIMETSNTLS